MSVDSIGNFLTTMRNGCGLGKRFVVAPFSKIKLEIAQVLKNEGFIRDIEIVDEELVHKKIKVYLKYVDGESVIHEITRISTPGLRRYQKAKNMKPVIGNLGISILTTNKGIMDGKQAKAKSVGGEVICTVW